MIEIKEKKICNGCYACYSICPKNAISMIKDEYGFEYPFVDKQLCINCGLCENVCPVINIIKVDNRPEAFATYNMNDGERLNSSSGGIFILLAKQIIKDNGIIYGAAFDNDFNVKHIRIVNENELLNLQTSKYVQSKIGDTYRKAKKDLENGKKVLFTGTPCQIQGLLKYLNKDYTNLYTQDIICHGVPSPKAWTKYLNDNNNEVIKSINFRNKEQCGWQNYSIKIQYENERYEKNHSKDAYMKAFLQNLILRDSCYNCNFKDINRASDITLGDFWGIDNVEPKMNDDKGISLVIINSKKGKELFDLIKNKTVYKEVILNQAIQYNSAMTESVEFNKNREPFFKNIDKVEFEKLVQKYEIKETILKKICRRFRNKIKKVLKTKK